MSDIACGDWFYVGDPNHHLFFSPAIYSLGQPRDQGFTSEQIFYGQLSVWEVLQNRLQFNAISVYLTLFKNISVTVNNILFRKLKTVVLLRFFVFICIYAST